MKDKIAMAPRGEVDDEVTRVMSDEEESSAWAGSSSADLFFDENNGLNAVALVAKDSSFFR